jgi:hypothetical protein
MNAEFRARSVESVLPYAALRVRLEQSEFNEGN